jgi:hypothetical protein
MSLQLIFVVETNKTCKSDWIYIKDTIDYFFEYDRTAIKLTPVYMERENTKIKKKKFQKILLHIRREEKDDRRK